MLSCADLGMPGGLLTADMAAYGADASADYAPGGGADAPALTVE